MDWPENMTPQQLCDWLQVPFSETLVTYWRQRRGLPAIMFNVDKEPTYRYPLSLARQWRDEQAKKESKKNANRN